ncbi:MAG TPA: hypothetical protein VMK16_00830 [Acidimicrobiales bacterium]|nr:hypothetical protein [Acidimicrobiales bacterium]
MAADSRRSTRVETLATILLAVAAVATAWATYQSAQWRGEQAVHGAKSTAARIESSTASTHAGQLAQIDVATFTQWIDATEAGKTQLADFYRARFRDEFKPAFDAWLATQPLSNPNAPSTPFAMTDYQLAENKEADRLDSVALAESAEAATAIDRSDDYMLAVVLFAASLFFAGISTKLQTLRHREVLLGLGALLFLGTFVWIAIAPKLVA